MRKMYTVLFLLSFLLFLPLNTFAHANLDSIFNSNEKNEEENQIDEAKARSALEDYIIQNDFEHKDEKIVLKEVLYDVDDTLLAYYFTFQETDGYAIVTAVNTLNPINEYSEKGHFNIPVKEKNTEKAYYLGVGNVVFANNTHELQKWFDMKKNNRLTLLQEERTKYKKIKKEMAEKKVHSAEELKTNTQNKTNRTESEHEKSITNAVEQFNRTELILADLENEINELSLKELKPFNKKEKVSKYWKELEEGAAFQQEGTSSETITTLATNTEFRLAVDRFWQRNPYVSSPNSACGPTTGAMIMDYYHDVRGFNIRDNEYYGGTSQQSIGRLVNHMEYDMNTTAIGSSLYQVAYGMLNHVKETATSSWSYVQVKDAHIDSYNKSLKYRSSINSRHPVAVRFDYFSSNPDLDYHVVAGSGWRLDGVYKDNLMVEYMDPDNGQNNTNTRSFDWSNNAHNFEFTFLTF